MESSAVLPKPVGWKILVILILVTIITYGNSISNGFVWDDLDIIVRTMENVKLQDVKHLFLKADTVGNLGTPYYRPLTRATFVLDQLLYGENPLYYHVGNVVLHLLAVLLLFFIALRLSGLTTTALIAALLFALHPINAERSILFLRATICLPPFLSSPHS